MVTVDLSSPLVWLILLLFATGPILIVHVLLPRLDPKKEPGTYFATCIVGAQLGLIGGLGFYGFLITLGVAIVRAVSG